MRPTRTRPIRNACPERSRRDGWTPERQLAFLAALTRTHSVSRSAAFAGMSRESAYRLRKREPRGLFALAWERAIGERGSPLTRAEIDQGHIGAIVAACGIEGASLRLNLRHGQHRELSRAVLSRRRITQASG